MSAIQLYHQFQLNVGKKLIDLEGSAVYIALFTSSSNAMSRSVSPATYSNFTNEVASGNGYTTGGAVVGGNFWYDDSAFYVSSPNWNVTGAGFTFKAAVLYDLTDSGRAIGYWIVDPGGGDTVFDAGVHYINQDPPGHGFESIDVFVPAFV